jgi:hypothetical protein
MSTSEPLIIGLSIVVLILSAWLFRTRLLNLRLRKRVKELEDFIRNERPGNLVRGGNRMRGGRVGSDSVLRGFLKL